MNAIIDSVNKEKNLFHYVVSRNIQGIIRFSETTIIPEEGKFLEIYLTSKKDIKHNKLIFKAIEIRETTETKPELIKSIQGDLELKYKRGGNTLDFFDLSEEERISTSPDFGFIEDFYVPKNILTDSKITSNCCVVAKAIFSGDKWKILKLEKY